MLADDGEAGQGEAAGHGEGQAVSLAGRWGEGGAARVLAPRGLLCERERGRDGQIEVLLLLVLLLSVFPPPGFFLFFSVCTYLKQGRDDVCVKKRLTV